MLVSQKITFWFIWWLSMVVNHWLVPVILRFRGRTCSEPINNQWHNAKSPRTVFRNNMFYSRCCSNEDHATIALCMYRANTRGCLNVLLFALREFLFPCVSCVGIEKFQEHILLNVTHNLWDDIFNQLNCFTSFSVCLVLKHNLLKTAYWRQPRCCCLVRNRLCSSKVYRCSGTWALNWKVAFSFF